MTINIQVNHLNREICPDEHFALFFSLKLILTTLSILKFLLCIHLNWHMHQEYSSDGSLSLTITLFGTIQSISLQHTEQVLLSEYKNIHNTISYTHKINLAILTKQWTS